MMRVTEYDRVVKDDDGWPKTQLLIGSTWMWQTFPWVLCALWATCYFHYYLLATYWHNFTHAVSRVRPSFMIGWKSLWFRPFCISLSLPTQLSFKQFVTPFPLSTRLLVNMVANVVTCVHSPQKSFQFLVQRTPPKSAAYGAPPDRTSPNQSLSIG